MKTATTDFPNWFEPTLLDALQLETADLRGDSLVSAVRTLNHGWVAGDVELPEQYGGVGDLRTAYAAFYMPMNMPKLWFMLDRAPSFLPDERGLTICEVGCGPGTFILAAALWLSQHRPGSRLNAVGVDHSPEMLALAKHLVNRFRPHLQIEFNFETIAGDWRELELPPADCTIFGNVLTEGGEGGVVLPDVLADARIAIIEPGTSASFARLRPWRDSAAAAGRTISFPCPTGDGACPMAADNWCHFHVNRLQLPMVQRVCSAAGRLNPRHHFCGFLFGPSEAKAAASDCWRVLSRVRKAHRSGIRFLCDGCVMPEVVLNRRTKSPENRAFLDADAGDLVRIMPANSRRRLQKNEKIAASDTVEPRLGSP